MIETKSIIKCDICGNKIHEQNTAPPNLLYVKRYFTIGTTGGYKNQNGHVEYEICESCNHKFAVFIEDLKNEK